MSRNAFRSLWAEPRAPQAPRRVWRDWALVAALMLLAVAEGIFREPLVWRPVALVLGAALVLTLLRRRTNPLAMVAIAFGAQASADVATLYGADDSTMLYATGFVSLFLTYALFRWGSGREAALGLAIILVGHFLRSPMESGVIDAVFWVPFWLFVAALGASVRFRANSRLRDLDRVKLREREQLARELHDTVAHHVSAIVIQAQAGRTVAGSHPDAAVNALEVIEEAASRALAEMRIMVGVLRNGEEPDLAPQPGVADIEGLAHRSGDRPRVDVQLSGDLDDLIPSVDAAIYRLAQESVTNAVRHARHATRISVCVAGDNDCVRLSVRDDGDARPNGRSPSGYGVVGMTERATLLGGTFEAGPSPERGWTVTAVLPRAGTVT